MPGGRCGLFPSLEAQRAARVRREHELLPESVVAVAHRVTGARDMKINELMSALENCSRCDLETLGDVLDAYEKMGK